MSLVIPWLALSGFICLVSAKNSTGLLLAGGNSINSAQIWTKDSGSCVLPPLLATESGHTVDSVSGSLVDCHGTTCNQLTPEEGWEEVVRLLEPRLGHTSAVISDDLLLLLGGQDSSDTTELVDVAKGETTASFTLQPGRQFHCSVQLTSDTVVLTGGLGTETLVTEFSNLGQTEPSVKELPGLQDGRRAHACGSFTVADSIFLLVSGGTNSLQHLASTEVIEYPSGSSWRFVGELPSPRCCLGETSLNGELHIAGGYSRSQEGFPPNFSNEVLVWDAVSEVWELAGYLDSIQYYPIALEVQIDDLEGYC